MKSAVKFALTAFVMPVGLFVYVLFYGYPPEYWTAVLIGLILLAYC